MKDYVADEFQKERNECEKQLEKLKTEFKELKNLWEI